ncbi:hypothetical protein C2869_02750 [Saccharobesus litoralis]|uniref:Uncharacterized protein n=1 Tax=Saccharobesus litoralis TaxID=2172099 RepID=A0A2S0VMU6_9ALTE|nr:TRAP transporter substrate-binding protein DctP [Saccharobesus litoralis]AWB65420.1 hypothetical protein C2869_02750 [Saccharobesus litoralis]
MNEVYESQSYAQSLTNKARLNLRVSDALTERFPSVQALHVMANEVAELSNGEIQLTVIANGEQGEEHETLKKLATGELAMTRVNLAQLNDPCPKTLVMNLPFIFDSKAHLHACLDSQVGQTLLQAINETGFVGLGFYESGERHFYTDRQFNHPDDLKDVQLRVPNSAIWHAIANALEAKMILADIQNVGIALRRGGIDAAENNLFTYLGLEHYQSSPYCLLTQHVMAPDVLLFSGALWQQLNNQDKNIIQQAAQKSVMASREFAEQFTASAKKQLIQQGVHFIENTEQSAWIEALQPVYQAFIGEEQQPLYQQILALKNAAV